MFALVIYIWAAIVVYAILVDLEVDNPTFTYGAALFMAVLWPILGTVMAVGNFWNFLGQCPKRD